MTFKLTNNQPSKRLLRFLPWAAFGLCFLLILSSGITQAARLTVNPYEWIPVITEFQIDQRLTRPMQLGQDFPFTRIKDESEDPNKPKPRSIPKDWKILKDMVKIRLIGGRWGEEEPVISGWRTWVDEEGESGIEVMRSDKFLEAGPLPLYTFVSQQNLFIRWKIEIWGGYRFKDPDPNNPTLSLLGPGDDEYQDLIKERIELRDFSLKVYKVEGDLSLKNIKKNIRNDVLLEPFDEGVITPFLELGKFGSWKSLADYEAEDYFVERFMRHAGHIGEVQLTMKLIFPEVDQPEADEQGDTSTPQREWQSETPVEVYLRYISANPEFEIDVTGIEQQRAP